MLIADERAYFYAKKVYLPSLFDFENQKLCSRDKNARLVITPAILPLYLYMFIKQFYCPGNKARPCMLQHPTGVVMPEMLGTNWNDTSHGWKVRSI